MSVQLVSHGLTPFSFFAVVFELVGAQRSFFPSYLLVINAQHLSMMDRSCHIAEASLHTFIADNSSAFDKV